MGLDRCRGLRLREGRLGNRFDRTRPRFVRDEIKPRLTILTNGHTIPRMGEIPIPAKIIFGFSYCDVHTRSVATLATIVNSY